MQEAPEHMYPSAIDTSISELEDRIATLEKEADALSDRLLGLPEELDKMGTDVQALDRALDAFIADSFANEASLRIDEAMKPLLAEAVVSAINIPEIAADDLAESIKDQ